MWRGYQFKLMLNASSMLEFFEQQNHKFFAVLWGGRTSSRRVYFKRKARNLGFNARKERIIIIKAASGDTRALAHVRSSEPALRQAHESDSPLLAARGFNFKKRRSVRMSEHAAIVLRQPHGSEGRSLLHVALLLNVFYFCIKLYQHFIAFIVKIFVAVE